MNPIPAMEVDSLDSMRRRMADIQLDHQQHHTRGTPNRSSAATAASPLFTTVRRPGISVLRLDCVSEIRANKEIASRAASDFRHSLSSIRSSAQETLANQENAVVLKDQLKGLEASLFELLKAKTCRESIYSASAESLDSVDERILRLKEIVEDQKKKKTAYAEIISQQLAALEGLEAKTNKETVDRRSLDETIAWYNRVLGFQIEGGQGVKFIFKKIELANPEKEYSFTVSLDGDVYSLLQCDPYVGGVDDLVRDLNKTNGLFKFVRIMREQFVAFAVNAALPKITSRHEDASAVTVSSPPSISMDSVSERTPTQSSALQTKALLSKKASSQKVTPESSSVLRRSSRLQVKKSM